MRLVANSDRSLSPLSRIIFLTEQARLLTAPVGHGNRATYQNAVGLLCSALGVR
jgi:hypothetical protein